MNKIIFKLGWPGALVVLVGVLSLGIYTIVSQSTVEDETKDKNLKTEKVLSEKNNTKPEIDTNLDSKTLIDEKKLSKENQVTEKKSNIKILDQNDIANNDYYKKNLNNNVEKDDLEIKNKTDVLISKGKQNLTQEQEEEQEEEQDQVTKNLTQFEKTDDNLVNEETKVDIVRVDESGLAVIAGNADASTTIEARINNETIGKAQVDQDGKFVITGEVSSSNQPQELEIITKKDEKLGEIEKNNIVKNEKDWVYETKSFVILPGIISSKNTSELKNEKLDYVRIVEVKKEDILLKEDYVNITVEKLTLDRIKYSENGTAVLYGRARNEMNVMVYLNNKFKTKSYPSKDGSWVIDLGFISPGIYKLRIDETTNSGEVKFRIETPFKQEPKDLLDKMFTKAITVQPGNSLWRIARRIYGRGIMYVDIYNKNNHLIKDPDLIYPGQIFSLLD